MSTHEISRRSLLRAAALGVAGAAIGRAPVLAEASEVLRETPNVTLGPFYPLSKPEDQDADLTSVRGRAGHAAGVVLSISGLIRDRNGRPVQDATIEVWQANTNGRYRHPSDFNTAAAVDPNFEGYAVLRTDAQGRYHLRTIRPGPYPAFDGDWVRAPHIHFDIRGRFDRKITQLYFANEPLNSQDRIFQAVRRHDALLASVAPHATEGSSGAPEFSVTWDITLASG